jgi:hypothetical protein
MGKVRSLRDAAMTLSNVGDDIELPMIFAYSNDTILLCDKKNENTTEKLKVVSKMKYMGLYLTDTFRIKENVAKRIKKVYKAMRVILPFVKKTRLPWTMAQRLYNTVIAPVVLYGMPETYLTKSNRMSLRAMEESIITRPQEQWHEGKMLMRTPTIGKMLGKRTVNNRITTVRLRYWGHIRRRERISYPTENGSVRDQREAEDWTTMSRTPRGMRDGRNRLELIGDDSRKQGGNEETDGIAVRSAEGIGRCDGAYI